MVVLAPVPGQTPSFQGGRRVAHGWVAAGGDDLEAAGCIDRLGPGEARGRGGKSRDRSLKLSPQCPCVCMFQTEELNQQMVSSLEQLQSCWAEITELKCMVKCPGDRAAGPAQHGEPDAGLGLLLDQA